ncbi:LuxR C-terminal-related transcriptional regulator [Epilithonimonas pallida]|uniref:Regulatory protein, luxR family n=1 Tax=Epilithonimonas pallida TaxID=373671 RepID=A0ABY1QY39_9FLAO|nr:LuxR C-terminal-related transcriptional regulator [Epilithonimonas pallida]SMP88529.1 regulatory protein, luxR family [Epilithonimonas pallida]
MNFNFTKYFSALLILFFIFINAKKIDLHSIEEEIIQYNREGKHKLSQKKLSDILLNGDLTKEEEGNILFLMATTYRSVNDYMMCIEYLNRSNSIARQLPPDNILRMKIDYEYAFVYFDNNDYEKAEEAMKRIASKNYVNAFPEDNSYILMQEGYLFMIKKKYNEAEKKYYEAMDIMENANTCNVPIVYVKLMNLYGKRKDIGKAEEAYKESMQISDSCNILKYKILASSEMEKIYKENNLFAKAYLIGSKLDSLRRLENQDVKISEMHIVDKALTEKEQIIKEESDIWKRTVVLIVLILLSVLIAYYFFRKNKKIKKDRLRMKEEIEQMKEELNQYSQNSSDEKILNPELDLLLNSNKLTDRQKDLLILLADGLSNKEIAEKLFISENTVKYHTKNIYNILDIKDRKDFFKKLRNN